MTCRITMMTSVVLHTFITSTSLNFRKHSVVLNNSIDIEWWDTGMVICLGRGADLYMA